MGNLFGKDGPLVRLSCIHVASGANDIHISCVDGAEKKGQEGEKKETKNFLSCFRRKTKNGRKKKWI